MMQRRLVRRVGGSTMRDNGFATINHVVKDYEPDELCGVGRLEIFLIIG